MPYKRFHKNGSYGKQCEGLVILYKNDTEVKRRHFDTRWRRAYIIKKILDERKKFRQLYGEGDFYISILLNI